MLKVRDIQLPLAHTTDGISFQLQTGEILGVIGKNTSGKSELLQCLATPSLSRSGSVSINNVEASHNSLKYKHLIGYLPNPVIIEPHLTGIEFLELVSGSYQLAPRDRTETILRYAEALGCHSEMFTLIERLPRSTQQKIAFIAAILHGPRVIFLDEPWQFLDWTAQDSTVEIIKTLQKEGTSFVIASNDLHRLEELTKNYLVIDEGAVLSSGTLNELSNSVQAKSKSLPDIWKAMERVGRLRD